MRPFGRHGHRRRAHGADARHRRQNVEHAVYRRCGRVRETLAIVILVAGGRNAAHARAETPLEAGEHRAVASGRHDPGRAEGERHGDAGRAEIAGRAVDQQRLAGLEADRQQTAIGHGAGPERAPFRGVGGIDGAERRHVLGRQPYLLRERAVAIVARQFLGALAGGREAEKRDVGRERIVARTDRRIAGYPVADREFCRVRADSADAPDGAGAGRQRQFQRVVALTADHLVHIRQHTRGGDVDNHLARADLGRRQLLDRERRAEGLQNGGSQVRYLVLAWPHRHTIALSIQTWRHPVAGSRKRERRFFEKKRTTSRT